ncbi:MAG: radical SAM family heme chaperone HemW [Lachnospiraceae bacterium]
MNRELELYIHIPFCIKKCAYCDFLSEQAPIEEQEKYVQALEREINSYQRQMEQYEITTIFLGGGTPSILKTEQIARILQALRTVFRIKKDVEITIEVNPGTVTWEKLQGYKQAGIQRLSIGLQTVQNAELKWLGRIHTYEQFLETYQMARDIGYTNINIDLISAIPGQTVASWMNTLQHVIALNPEHISAYSLIIEEGTPFYEWYGPQKKIVSSLPQLPGEEEERQIYEQTEVLLEQAGYQHYEISNYAKSGYECQHNLGYWKRTEYLGLGIGAASLLNETRHTNCRIREYYIAHAKDQDLIHTELETLSIKSQMEEYMFLGLRMIQGVSESMFQYLFQSSMETVYGIQLETLTKKGLLVREERNGQKMVRLTKRGIDVSNYVLSEFLQE